MNSFDLRYHAISIAAVFVALGIGLLVGTTMMGTPFVERLNKRLERQERQIKELDARARGQEGNEEALKLLTPRIVAGQLIGLEIVVVQLGDPAAADAAIAAVRKAGGTPRRLVLPDELWEKLSDLERERQTRLLAETLRGNMEASQQMTDALVIGDLPPASASRLVLAGGGDHLRQNRDLALAQALTDKGCTVVAVELMTTEPTAARAWAEPQIPFVDCIDRAVGQICLVRTLRGDKGWFGLKQGAERVLPAVFAQRSGASPSPTAPLSPVPTP